MLVHVFFLYHDDETRLSKRQMTCGRICVGMTLFSFVESLFLLQKPQRLCFNFINGKVFVFGYYHFEKKRGFLSG